MKHLEKFLIAVMLIAVILLIVKIAKPKADNFNQAVAEEQYHAEHERQADSLESEGTR